MVEGSSEEALAAPMEPARRHATPKINISIPDGYPNGILLEMSSKSQYLKAPKGASSSTIPFPFCFLFLPGSYHNFIRENPQPIQHFPFSLAIFPLIPT